MERRTFLKSGTLGVAAFLAGCGGGGSGSGNSSNASTAGTSGENPSTTGSDAKELQTTQSGPAQFADATIQGPANVTVGEEFSLPVSVANTGGQNGTFNETLTVAEGASSFNKSVSIEGVKPGSTANTSVGPLNITSADNYTLALKGANTTHTIQVAPVEKQAGSAITADNLKITVRGIRLTPALFFGGNEGGFSSDQARPGLLSAASRKILCVIQVALENVGTNQAEFTIPANYSPNSGLLADDSGPPPMLTLPKGSFYTELPNSRGNLDQVQGMKGKPLTNVQLSAGQSRNGWLVGQLPRSVASNTVQVGYQGDTKGSTPEAVWPFAPKSGSNRSLPQFSLQTFNIPNKVQLGRGGTYEIRVTNTGKAAGTYRGVTEFNAANNSDWTGFKKQQTKLSPGESKTFAQEFSYPADPELGEVQFRVQPFGKTSAVTFETAKLNFGDTYRAPLGRNVTVSDIQQTNTYQMADNDEPITPQQNQHYILVKIGAKFVTQDADTVNSFDFNLVSGGSTYDPISEYGDRYVAPVQADAVSGDLTGPKGSMKSGYIVYSVPRSVTPSSSKIVWSAETPWAQWQQGRSSQ